MPPVDKDSTFRPKARVPRGFRDRRGPALAAERDLVEKISKVYEAWGFERLETPAFEYADALGKFLPDQDRPNEGVFALEDDDSQWMALRYDLTAPLARFVAENFDALPKPYRRWAAGPVWRNEKPGPGRYREFWQCDADTVGTASPAADAEMIAMACEALEAAGIGRGRYVLRVSTRKLLEGVMEAANLSGDANAERRRIVMRAIDKKDRLGVNGVRELLGAGRMDESGDYTPGAGLNASQIDIVMEFMQPAGASIFKGGPPDEDAGEAAIPLPGGGYIGVPDNQTLLDEWAHLIGKTQSGAKGLLDLQNISDTLRAMRIGAGRWIFDPAVVRGLEYYTGIVFEAELFSDFSGEMIKFGSVGGGGRYDDLVARFTGQQIPATGFSIGVSRLVAALEAAKENEASADGPIVVLPFDKEGMAECFTLAQKLRSENLRAEVYLGGSGPKAQLKYADKRNAPVAVILGADERKNGEVTLKDMKLGAEIAKTLADNREWREGRPAQTTVKQDELISAIHRMLHRQGAGDE